MKINEIFDSKIDNIIWTPGINMELTRFSVNDLTYHIQIHQVPIPGNFPKDAKTAEVSFFQIDDDNQPIYSTTDNSTNISNTIYGIVLHALVDKFKEYDAFYFSTEARHSDTPKQFEQKSRLYHAAANHIARKHPNTKAYNHKTPSGHDFIVSNLIVEQTDVTFNDLDLMLEQNIHIHRFVRK